jgi:hypothetical protein
MFKSENFILTFLMTQKTSPPLAGGEEGEGEPKSFSPPPPPEPCKVQGIVLHPMWCRAAPPPSKGEGNKRVMRQRNLKYLWLEFCRLNFESHLTFGI